MSTTSKSEGERRGTFITLEGVDGCGKTTIAKFVCEWLISKGFDAVYTVEPTQTWIGDCVKRGFSEPINPLTEALLFMADRAEHSLSIRKWISEGRTVVSDRYVDSTLAYQGASIQGYGIKDAVEWLRDVSATHILVPDMTILLSVDPAICLQRISNRPRRTKFETLDFLVQVSRVYERLAGSEERFRRVDASQPLDRVKEDVIKVLENEL